MAAPEKTADIYSVLGKTEAVYGTPETLSAATDGIETAGEDLPSFTRGWAYDGNRGPAAGHLGLRKRAQPGGAFATGNITVEYKGAGAIYDGSTFVPNLSALMQSSGLVETLNGDEREWTPGASEGTTLELYTHGEVWRLAGVLTGGFDWTFEPGRPSTIEFQDVQGILVFKDDSTPAVPTYLAPSIIPPNVDGMAVSLFGVSVQVRRMVWQHRIPRAQRLLANIAGAFGGFGGDRREDRVVLTIENPLKTTLDLYAAEDAATEGALSWTLGGTANNMCDFSFPQGTLSTSRDRDEVAALQEVTFTAHGSDEVTGDEFLLTNT